MAHAVPNGDPYYVYSTGCCYQNVISDGGGDASALFFVRCGGGPGTVVALGANYVPSGHGYVASFGLIAPVELVTSCPLFSWLYS